MPNTRTRLCAGTAAVAATLVIASISLAQAPAPPQPALMAPMVPPSHVVDLMTAPGASALSAQWRVSDVKIVEVPAIQGAMPQYKTTYNYEPQAGPEKFDDSKWPVIEPKDLAARRSGGHLAFMWYRTPLTIPAKIGDFDTSGAIAVLNVTVDDYAEVWVNGAIPGRSGFPRPATIQGHNVPQRVVLSSSVKSGDKFQIAVFGINGPISVAPANTVWFREAKMEFFK
jgi:gluconolactonase